MPLVAIRRNLGSQIVFFRQIGELVQYSFDEVIWFNGWTMPVGKEGSIYTQNETTIEQWLTKYYQENNFINVIVSQEIPPTSRTELINNIEQVQTAYPSKKAICQSAYAFALAMKQVIQDARAGELESSPEVQTAKTAGNLTAAASGILGLVGAVLGWNPIGWGLMALGVATGIATNVGLPALLASLPELTDTDVENLACCLYEAMKNGGTYADFQSSGCDIGGVAWEDIATPEFYAGFVAMVDSAGLNGSCPCEECILLTPTMCQVNTGAIVKNAGITTSVNTGGSVFEMQLSITAFFDPMVITSVKVCTAVLNYENVATPTPTCNFNAPSTGGGTTAVPNGIGVTQINPAHYPLLAVDNCTLVLRASTCSACSASQTASFNNSYGSICWVEICGNPA